MAINVVNLDAMIPREDFSIEGGGERLGASGQERIDIHHLDNHFFSTRLRKPDFQRETAHWTPDKVVDLIRSFVDADLIPAVILWQAGNCSFVIDGAHRLSALLAWVLNDYGDQKKSLEFFGGRISDEQRRIAERTRKLVNNSVGAYGEYAAARKDPSALPPEMQIRYNNLANQYITAQWVPTVDRDAAEESFFKINEAATPIDPTEKRILRARKSASALAARAVTRAGTGHQYWSPFQEVTRNRIKELGKHIYEALYEPPIAEGPVKTLDLPVAGKGYNALPFVFDLVNQVNRGQSAVTLKKSPDVILPEDLDGAETIKFLERVRRLVDRFTGDTPASFGVHPVVYFYTRTGAFQPSAFFATARLIETLVTDKRVKEYLAGRNKFEQFLLEHKEHVSLTVHKFGSGERSVPQLLLYFETILKECLAGNKIKTIISNLGKDANFAYLIPPKPPLLRAKEGDEIKKGFSRHTKSATFIDTAVTGAPRCGLCGAMVHKNSMHFDHKTRMREGGNNDMKNAQITHPICDALKG